MGLLWTCLNTTAALLEPDERQSVLGDIQERGASARDVLDLLGLILLRQLQSFRSWKTWALGVALYVPVTFAISMAVFLPRASLTPFLRNPSMFAAYFLGATILAWTCGYAVGSLGKRRAAILLLVIPSAVFVLGGATLPRRMPILIAATFLVATIGAISWFGFVHGIHNRPLGRLSRVTIAVLGTAVALQVFPNTIYPPLWIQWTLGSIMLWPVIYTFVAPVVRRTRKGVDQSTI